MPILGSQIVLRYTHPDTRLGISNAEASRGGYMSRVALKSGVLHNLFDEFTSLQNNLGGTEYRCLCVLNAHPELPLTSPKLWISRNDTRGVAFWVGLGTNGVQSSDAFLSQVIPVTTAEPSGVRWVDPRSEETALALPTLQAGWACAVWFKRSGRGVKPVLPETNMITIKGRSAL